MKNFRNSTPNIIFLIIVIIVILFSSLIIAHKGNDDPINVSTSKKYIDAKEAVWEKDQSLGAAMTNLDYGNDSFIIFHGYFGLFVYDLKGKKISHSLDLKAIGCDGIQGDNVCMVTTSKDGNKIYLHPINASTMYVFDLNANQNESLYKVQYKEQPPDTIFHTVNIEKAVENVDNAIYSDEAIEYKANNITFYGYLETSDFTIGTLTYVMHDKVYQLF